MGKGRVPPAHGVQGSKSWHRESQAMKIGYRIWLHNRILSFEDGSGFDDFSSKSWGGCKNVGMSFAVSQWKKHPDFPLRTWGAPFL